jgi:WD40 repeat protein
MNVQDLAFSPDGQWVVSGGWDDMAQVWKTATGRKVACMEHEGWVNAVAFSPDGQWVATASNDGTARVWEASTGREVARMEHEGQVNAVAFSPDGQWVASASSDGTARVWALQPKNLIMQVCSHLPRNLTLEEWQQYIGDEPYRPTCPNLPVPEE